MLIQLRRPAQATATAPSYCLFPPSPHPHPSTAVPISLPGHPARRHVAADSSLSGSYRRTELLAASGRQAALRTFMNVWGVGEKTAGRWYAEGCRTLEDVARRGDLSIVQRTGLRHYKDFLVPIPREQVAAAEAIVQKV